MAYIKVNKTAYPEGYLDVENCLYALFNIISIAHQHGFELTLESNKPFPWHFPHFNMQKHVNMLCMFDLFFTHKPLNLTV